MRNFIVFVLSLFLIAAQNLHAQNLTGYKVYVSKRKITTLYFHDNVTNNHFGEKTYPYKVEALMRTPNSIPLSVDKPVTELYTLYVTEGGRQHKFIIVYKDDVDISQQDIYFTDLKQLAKLSKDLSSQPTAVIQVDRPVNADSTAAVSKQPTNSLSANVYALLDSADKARENQQLESARDKYEQALKLQPDNTYAQTQLATVKKMIENRDASKYDQIVKDANNAFAENRLDDALRYYTAALSMKPDDIYLNGQIDLIRQKLARAKVMEEQRQKDSLFQSYIYAGDKSLLDKSYETAKVAYGKALEIRPNDAIATSKLNMVDQKIVSDSLAAAQQRIEDLYISYVNAGDKAMQEKSYATAKAAYNEALVVKPNDAVVMGKLRSIAEKIVADSLAVQQQEKENLYAGYIALGDQAFKDQSYDVARSNYNDALQVKPGDAYGTSQVQKINEALTELQKQAERELAMQKNLERQDQYKSVINLADQYYNSGMYPEAKEQYNKALELNKTDVYSKNKMAQINKTLTAQKERQRLDSIDGIRYTEAIVKGDVAFDRKDYTTAKSSYTTALKYKEDDAYAKEKLYEIEGAIAELAATKQAQKDSLQREAEATKKYNALMASAKTAYSGNDYTTAKVMYAAAVELKPNEQEARNKLAEIENKLAEIAKEKERTELLDSLTSMADIALANQLLEVAMSNYQQAVTLSTGDESYYLHRQIHYIEQEVVRQDSLARLQQRAKQVDAAVNAYEQGKEALKYLNYEVALANFNLFLNLADSDMFALSEYNLEPMMKFTTAKVHDIEDYLARKNANTAIVDTSRLVRPKNETFTTLLFYPNPKDPGLETVYAKHPEIDFNAPPDDQRFDTIADYSVESKLISREIMSLKPEMNVTDSTSQVKLICQNIEFKGSKVYYKFLVQNYDSTEFLTGKMILTYHRKDGTEIEVLPNYVANFPIILAGRQKVLVYLAKLIPVANDENLTFQMSDRLNRMTLSLSIPGELYNQKQVALSKH